MSYSLLDREPRPLTDEQKEVIRSTWATSVNRNAVSAEWSKRAMDGTPQRIVDKYGELLDAKVTSALDEALADMTLDEVAEIGWDFGLCVPWPVYLQAKEAGL